jgi:uncharacterized protein YdaU (DUF1376 family)
VAKPPAFQFYVKDWLGSASVAMMTNEQRGCYIQLLAYSWPDGIPCPSMADASSIAKHMLNLRDDASSIACLAPVLAQFEVQDGKLVHPRLVEQFHSMASYHTMTAERAKKAAESRWGKKDASSMPQAMLGDASSSASSICNLQSENSTVQDGTERSDDQTGNGEAKAESAPKAKPSVAKIQGKISVKPAPADPTEEEMEFLDSVIQQWMSYKLPKITEFPASLLELIRKYGETVPDVMAWMMFINNDGYWKNRIHSVADFTRCFPKMFEQYVKCGGSELAKALEVAGKKYAEEQNPEVFQRICANALTAGKECFSRLVPEPGQTLCPKCLEEESFVVEDVDILNTYGLEA